MAVWGVGPHRSVHDCVLFPILLRVPIHHDGRHDGKCGVNDGLRHEEVLLYGLLYCRLDHSFGALCTHDEDNADDDAQNPEYVQLSVEGFQGIGFRAEDLGCEGLAFGI